jgi:heptosyltransferase-2
MKILIIQTAFIGDVILATALVEKLHQFYPNSQLDFLLRKGNEGLLENHPIINNVLIWDKREKKYDNLKVISKSIKKTRYDAIINLQRFASTGLITAFSGAKHKIGFKKNPLSFSFTKKVEHKIGDGTHEVERNQQLIAHLTDNIALKEDKSVNFIFETTEAVLFPPIPKTKGTLLFVVSTTKETTFERSSSNRVAVSAVVPITTI